MLKLVEYNWQELSECMTYFWYHTSTTVLHHYTGQAVLAGTPVKNWRIWSKLSPPAYPYWQQLAQSAFGLGRRL